MRNETGVGEGDGVYLVTTAKAGELQAQTVVWFYDGGNN